MAGTLLNFNFKFPDWADLVESQMPQIKRKAMATVQTNRGLLFKYEGAHNGHSRWKELKSGASNRVDSKSGEVERKILQKTGTLRKSIYPNGANPNLPKAGPNGILQFNGDIMKIGTLVKYAAIHNNGGVIRKGDKNIRIPKRAFLSGAWNSTDQEELDTTIANYITRILGTGRGE